MECQSFEPVFTHDSRVLILGSMPGIASLEASQYYAHPRNAFWPVLFSYFGKSVSASYSDRCMLIRDNDLALWDVCRTCQREGSLDTAIRDAAFNDFHRIFDVCGIQAVLCNGQKAYCLFRRTGFFDSCPVFCMPSTSPAFTMPFQKKCSIWHDCLRQALA